MIQANYNPDVLTCLANLSNDEVFTSPSLVNEILDLLPEELWKNKETKVLDPVSKTGVFLREIAKRFMTGLESEIPDRQARINHIFKNQLYGVAITELTSLLSRRSVYCSKLANGKYSICEAFEDEKGNIIYDRTEHIWLNGSCKFCGASQGVYDRNDALETHAYQFIHSSKPKSFFKNMRFDVIIGNPPYQLNDGGGTGSSAKPIYNKFVDQAKKLNPRYLSMIIPARWYSGGKGLDDFRNDMLNDSRIRHLVDFADSRDCFPGVDIAGGVCYFLWDRDNKGDCQVKTIRKSQSLVSSRNLSEFGTFIRDNLSIDIVKKIRLDSQTFLDSIVSSRMPFGLVSSVKPKSVGDLNLITSNGNGKIDSNLITSGHDLIKKWKVLLSKASNDHGGQPDKEGKRRIFSRIEVMPPNTVCTESYLVVGSYDTEEEAKNMANFLRTRFCRFLVSTILLTQNITKGTFTHVPLLQMTELWDDTKLFKKYGITNDEIHFIESVIRPIDLHNE
ncbi:Eco57I restriction-modification methylase domain-containing protein [Candidatus Daviesbacteria bacterium]|nr:Eco57I restriction-modification methylase domain-containing protein [Candidatus Daviesbacteria bacterium]